jgi:hypothetical protein
MVVERCGACLLLALCLAAALASAGARAQEPTDAARAHFEEGVAHADRGEIDAAIVAFEAAYAASPHPSVLFNLGHAYSVAGRSLDAVRVMRAFLEQASSTPEQRQEAELLLHFNEARIGRLLFEVEPAEAVLSLDGRLLGQASSLQAVEVQAGSHVLRAEAPGRLPAVQQLSVEPWVAREQHIALVLEPAPTTPDGEKSVAAAPLAVPAPRSAGSDPMAELAQRRRLAAYVTGGLGLAAGISAATLYVVIHARHQSWDDTIWTDPDEMVDEATAIQRAEDIAAGCVIVGGTLIVSAVTLWLVSRREPAGSARRMTPARASALPFPSYRW